MSAFVIVDLTPLKEQKLHEYSAAAAATVDRYDGEFLARGPIEPLNGGEHRRLKAIIRFPNRDAALNWYASEEYQALIPLRDQGMDAVFHLVA